MGPGFESQPVHKAPREIGGLFCFKDVSKACFRKRTRSKKGNETRSGSLKTPEYSGQVLSKDTIQGCRRSATKPTIPFNIYEMRGMSFELSENDNPKNKNYLSNQLSLPEISQALNEAGIHPISFI